MSDHAYKKCQRLNARFAGSRRLRLHIDENEEERTLVYKYLKGNLFHFMNAYNGQPDMEATLQVMWETGKAVEELHEKNIMHMGEFFKTAPGVVSVYSQEIGTDCSIDLKPDNILLDWEETRLPDGAAGPPKVGKVIVSDLDSSFEMKGWSSYPIKEYSHVRFGNIRWRAPEMQTGHGIGLFSDVFALALVVGGLSPTSFIGEEERVLYSLADTNASLLVHIHAGRPSTLGW